MSSMKSLVSACLIRFSLLGIFLAVFLAGPSVAVAEKFTVVCMPDPQYYTTSNHPALYDLYNKQSQWIVANRAALNIKHVMWLGDLTNDNTLTQWSVASAAYKILDNANIPYGVIPGNHDYKTPTGWAGAQLRNLKNYNDNLGPQRFGARTWYGGNLGETSTHNENNYTFFSAAGQDYMAVGLEYAPRKEALTWANELISAHPNHRVIMYTHAYLTHDRKYTGGSSTATGTVGAHGSEVFDECASRHSNVFMMVCGHVGDTELAVKTGVSGNRVYEMLVDYQFEKVKGTGATLGNGWLRLLEFDTDTNKIEASTITVVPGDTRIFTNGITQFYLNTYPASPLAIDHKFSLNYDLTSPKPPYTYLNQSVAFHEMGVGNDLYANQTSPGIAQADNGNWVSVWTNRASNGTHNICIRGFDADGNERFAKTNVTVGDSSLTTATIARIAMAPDGRFVVAWQSGLNVIKARSYNPNGTPAGTEQVVQLVIPNGVVGDLDVAISASGDYVVAWADDGDADGKYQIKARGFTFNSVSRFPAKTVNSADPGQRTHPRIAMAPNGDYVIVWDEDTVGNWDVKMRGYMANENQKFAPLSANATTVGIQRSGAVAVDSSGKFVVIWEDDADLNGVYQVKARGFQATGAQRFGEFTVNVVSTGDQIHPQIAMDQPGNWYAVWEDNGISGGEGYQIMGNAYTSAGSRINDKDLQINVAKSVANKSKVSTPVRRNPVVSAHKSGRYTVSWADDMDADGAFQVLARGIAGTAQSLVVKAINGQVAKSEDQPFYAPGSTVQLTASPNPGSTFTRWTGDVPGGIQSVNPLTIVMDGKKSIIANFVPTSDVADWQLYN